MNRLMHGFPPQPQGQVTLTNWRSSPFNHWAFHHPSGRGYAFLAEMILEADAINPQVAARLVPPFGRRRRFEPKRAQMMREALERIVARPGLSRDVFEQASKSLV